MTLIYKSLFYVKLLKLTYTKTFQRITYTMQSLLSPMSATLTTEYESQFIDHMCVSHRYMIDYGNSSNVLATRFS